LSNIGPGKAVGKIIHDQDFRQAQLP